ncbi:MAG: hypothetical protein AAGB34_03415 [Planctomycetota bacterium]
MKISRRARLVLASLLWFNLTACQGDGPLADDGWRLEEGKLESYAERDGSLAWRLIRPGLITGSTVLIDAEGSTANLDRYRGEFVRIAGQSETTDDGQERLRVEFISPRP